MVSFIKMGLFEREAKTPEINTKQLALLLCGLDPELKASEIPSKYSDAYGIFYRHISKWINASRLFQRGNATPLRSDYMFALAYPLIDDEITPEPIQRRCLEAVAELAVRNGGKDALEKLGGKDLLAKGIELSKNQRGIHRKEDEKLNTEKLLGLLVKLISKKVGHSYGTSEKPVMSCIYNDLVKMAEDENISLDGLAKSTVYQKISDSLKTIEYSK
ncbi:hypothetical protein [Edaphovirga cremea]|uniref:hypothetical protein n=1 Tax=Edaphovirga cremea TaxID=2267246 RepID=UPI0039895CFC